MEQRLIDANALIKWINGTGCFMDVFKRITTNIINKQPTVDAVPVCRCCDCKWCEYPAHNSTKYGCKLFDRCVKGGWFCADGKRKDGAV